MRVLDDHIYIDFKSDASCAQPRGRLLERDRLRPNVSERKCVLLTVLGADKGRSVEGRGSMGEK